MGALIKTGAGSSVSLLCGWDNNTHKDITCMGSEARKEGVTVSEIFLITLLLSCLVSGELERTLKGDIPGLRGAEGETESAAL